MDPSASAGNVLSGLRAGDWVERTAWSCCHLYRQNLRVCRQWHRPIWEQSEDRGRGGRGSRNTHPTGTHSETSQHTLRCMTPLCLTSMSRRKAPASKACQLLTITRESSSTTLRSLSGSWLYRVRAARDPGSDSESRCKHRAKHGAYRAQLEQRDNIVTVGRGGEGGTTVGCARLYSHREQDGGWRRE